MNLDVLQSKISYPFKNKELLEEAFVHKSAGPEWLSRFPGGNERLEFLGDSVLEMVTTVDLPKTT